MGEIFNVAGFMVIFREVLEAAVIIAVLLQFVNKLMIQPQLLAKLKKQIWLGAISGFIVSIIFGIIVTVVFYSLGKNLFTGKTKALYEGVLLVIAVIMITFVALKMLKVDSLMQKWQAKTKDVISKELDSSNGDLSQFGSGWGLFIIVFSVVVREGFEAIIFVAGVGKGEPSSLILPAILGSLLASVFGFLLYRGGGLLKLHVFFKASCAFLLIIAAGLSAYAAHELEEYVYMVIDNGLEETPVLWDISDCCSHKTVPFFQIANLLVGYRSKATVATVTTYISYWIITGSVILFKAKKSTETKGSSLTV